jgi:hypothetical protein
MLPMKMKQLQNILSQIEIHLSQKSKGDIIIIQYDTDLKAALFPH